MQEVESASSEDDHSHGKHNKASPRPPRKQSCREEVVEVDDDVEAEDTCDDEQEVIDISGESESEVCKSPITTYNK